MSCDCELLFIVIDSYGYRAYHTRSSPIKRDRATRYFYMPVEIFEILSTAASSVRNVALEKACNIHVG